MMTRLFLTAAVLAAVGPCDPTTSLDSDGLLNLVFARGGQTDRYALTVTQTAFDISTIEAHFTHPTARRFPRSG